MNKILLIIRREYSSRVKKRSFIIMTVLGPLLMAATFIIPVYLANISDNDKRIGIIDETGLFSNSFKNHDRTTFETLYEDILTAKETFEIKGYDGILYIPEGTINSPSLIKLYSSKDIGNGVVAYLETSIQKELEAHKLALSGIDKSILDDIAVNVDIRTINVKDGEEKETYSDVRYATGLISGFLIYIFIFMFGSQVMRGVIEEKTSRIVEVIVSSVKPFQLMMGKIIGVALVGLTQFILWIILTFSIVTIMQESLPGVFKYQEPQKVLIDNKGLSPQEITQQQQASDISQDKANQILERIRAIDFPTVLLMFLFYFIGGYLLYASLFAAIGSAVDSETDTQQFMLPVTIPLVIAILSIQVVLNNPDGPVAFWLSMIPFTSPVVMMVRLPFGESIHYTEVIASMALLVAGFVLTTWMAAKIYRTGILMYGKKSSYRELWKWLRY